MDPHDHFQIEVLHPAPEVVLITLRGEVDLWTSFPLMEAIAAAVGEGPELIAVDLSQVRCMDEAGLRVLENGARHTLTGRFAVICPEDSEMTPLLRRDGLHGALNLHQSAIDALRPWLADEDEELAGDEKAPF